MGKVYMAEDKVQTLLHKFREIIIAVEQERHDLKKSFVPGSSSYPFRSATGSEGSSSAPSNTRQTAQRVYINNLNSDNTASHSAPTTRSSSTSSSSCHAALCTSATTRSGSSTNEPSSATFTSGLLTNSTETTNSCLRPPSYKTALKPQEVSTCVPQAPARTRRRRTLPASSTSTGRAQVVMSSSARLTRGALIVLEGLDRVGKSTLAKKLVEHLERSRKPVAHQRFPDRTTSVGKLINSFLLDGDKQLDEHTMHLLFSANRWELNKAIRKTINEGTTVIIDRYSYSGVAYSSAKRDLNLDWCKSTEIGLPRPDLVIYLELDRESQYKREGFGEERFETKELQELVRRQYEKVIAMSPDSWLRVEVTNKSPDQVLGEIIMPVRHCIEACSSKELGNLDFH